MSFVSGYLLTKLQAVVEIAHIVVINSHSAGIDFRRQNLASVDIYDDFKLKNLFVLIALYKISQC